MPSDANVLNYEVQGGAENHIGGTLIIDAGGKLIVATGGAIVPASGVLPAAITPAVAAAANPPTQTEFNNLVAKFNALLAVCQGAGVSQ